MEDKLKLALTFSGGGYRAGTFHLGTLSYLHAVKVGDSTLLKHVVIFIHHFRRYNYRPAVYARLKSGRKREGDIR